MNFKPLKNHMEVSTMDEVVLWEHTGKTADDMPIEEINAFFVDYLKKHGYEAGKILGKKLKSLEEKWIENNFIIEKSVLLASPTACDVISASIG